MYRKTIESEIKQTIGEYTIVKSVEQIYFDNGVKCGNAKTWYDVCLDNGDGDIVFSCDKSNEARKWARRHENG